MFQGRLIGATGGRICKGETGRRGQRGLDVMLNI